MYKLSKITLGSSLVLALTAVTAGVAQAQDTLTAQPQAPVVVELAAVGEAQGSGDAALLGTAAGQTEASVNVEGLPPGTQWSAFLIAGSCDAPGQVVAPLGTVEVGDSGTGSGSSTVTTPLAELTASAASVQIHPQGETPTQAVLCGAVAAAAPAGPSLPAF